MINSIIEEWGDYALFFSVMGVFLLAIWMVGKFEKPISMTITKVEKKGEKDEKDD